MAEVDPIDSSKTSASVNDSRDIKTQKQPPNRHTNSPAPADTFTPAQDSRGIPVRENPPGDMFNSKYATKPDINPQQTENKQAAGLTGAINRGIERFINITDKIAAVIGDIEKDIREKLSKTYVRMEEHIYDLMKKIDASFEQKDHHRERQTRDRKKQDTENSGRIDNQIGVTPGLTRGLMRF